MKITIVTPIRIESGHSRDLRRLRRLLANVPPEIEMLVVDDTADAAAARAVARAVARRPGTRHITSPETSSGPFAIGRLRDIGVAAAAEGAVLFHDVDFVAPRQAYRRLIAFLPGRLEAGGFVCICVAFLTPLGALIWRAAPRTVWRRALASGARPARGLVQRVVLGSSAIAARRADLMAVGGHDPAYVGHGAEDFDLMHRLLVHAGERPQSADYTRDYGSQDEVGGGFRAVFAEFGRPALADGIMLLHLWHPRRRADVRYYAARMRNFERLRETMKR